MGGSFGYGESKQDSRSTQDIWAQQSPYLQNLYGAGQQKLASQDQGYGDQFLAPAFQSWMSALNPQGNPWLQENVRNAQRMAAEGYTENILPAIQSSAVASGNLGGDRGGIAAGIAGREAVRGQGDIANQMYGRAYESDQQRVMQALSMTGGLAGLQGASWAPLMQYANLLGRPTTLGQSQSQGRAYNFDIGAGMFGG